MSAWLLQPGLTDIIPDVIDCMQTNIQINSKKSFDLFCPTTKIPAASMYLYLQIRIESVYR